MKGKHHKELFQRRLNLGLKSTTTLYSVLIIALLILFNFLYNNRIVAVTTMLLSGFVATFYSKNMIIVLLVSIASAIIVAPLISCMTREGMEDDASEKPVAGAAGAADTDSDTNVAGVTATGSDKKVIDSTDVSNTNDDINALVPDKKALNVPVATHLPVGTTKPTLTDLSHPINEANTNKDKDKDKNKKQPFGQRDLVPAQYNSYGADTDDIDINSRHKPKLDYAATLESAYDSLEKFLSSDAIKNMSDDTARLAEKQQQLMGNMTKIQPLIEKAGSVLNKMPDMGNMESMMNSLKGTVSGFTNKNIK